MADNRVARIGWQHLAKFITSLQSHEWPESRLLCRFALTLVGRVQHWWPGALRSCTTCDCRARCLPAGHPQTAGWFATGRLRYALGHFIQLRTKRGQGFVKQAASQSDGFGVSLILEIVSYVASRFTGFDKTEPCRIWLSTRSSNDFNRLAACSGSLRGARRRLMRQATQALPTSVWTA